MRQRRCLELIKDYDCTIEYHLGRANMVADALSRKSCGSLAHLRMAYLPLLGIAGRWSRTGNESTWWTTC
ncbi:unnamed protein product [Prunus armeniaca]